jgi:hypothetical protein
LSRQNIVLRVFSGFPDINYRAADGDAADGGFYSAGLPPPPFPASPLHGETLPDIPLANFNHFQKKAIFGQERRAPDPIKDVAASTATSTRRHGRKNTDR